LVDNFYKKDSIESLSPLDHVRLRPGMYAGDTTDATQLAIEILGNSIDEFNIGHGDTIEIYINPDWLNEKNVVVIRDHGQGFPLNVLREDGETVLQASFDVINTSGKYRDDGVYEGTAIGLNGIGCKLTNFLSHKLHVASFDKEGNFEGVFFKEGIFEKRETGKVIHGPGTEVAFIPSEEFFTSPTINEKKLKDFCEDITCLCQGLTIIFNEEIIKHENGIQDLLTKNISNSNIELLNNQFIFQETRDKQSIKLGMTYIDKTSSSIVPYVNCGLTTQGPHITSIKSCITRTLNKWAKEHKLLKSTDKNLDGNSLQEGIILVTNITSDNVAYNAQVKTTITKIDTSFISSSLGKNLEIWLDNHPNDAKIIIEKALLARKASEAAKRARENVRNKANKKTKKKKFIDMPTTLIDANGKDRMKCELIVVEGLSPASSLVAQRNAMISAVYSVRGMMLNLQKTAPEKIMQNKEINNLITALGLDYNLSNGKMVYDLNKLRYGKIIAASDADPAGNQIENLLFNILWELCPELIINGHVYSAEPPLFKITTKKNEYVFLADQQALNEYLKEHSNEVSSVHRAKGLAEETPEELASFILDPKTRKLKQLIVEDLKDTDKLFKDLYGKDVPPRVEYINNNIWNVEVDYE
jgi:DNA gyrase subunit B